jgi:hypothetical protein
LGRRQFNDRPLAPSHAYRRSAVRPRKKAPEPSLASNGRIFVGSRNFDVRLSLDQLYSARPVLGHADYRSPNSRPLYVRRLDPSRRRRHRRPRLERRPRDDPRFSRATVAAMIRSLAAALGGMTRSEGNAAVIASEAKQSKGA